MVRISQPNKEDNKRINTFKTELSRVQRIQANIILKKGKYLNFESCYFSKPDHFCDPTARSMDYIQGNKFQARVKELIPMALPMWAASNCTWPTAYNFQQHQSSK